MTVDKNIYFAQLFFGILSIENFVQTKKNSLATFLIIDSDDFSEIFGKNILGLNN